MGSLVPTSSVSLILSLLVSGLPLGALAQTFNPDDNGLPGGRIGGGTRGGGCAKGQLAALVPEKNLGLTTAEYPRFFWFSPKTEARLAEFELYGVDEQLANRTLIYKARFSITGQSGIVSLALPKDASIPTLTLNQNYHWFVSLICDADQNVTVNGWIKRVSLSPSITSQLQSLKPRERLPIYIRQGLWFDALTTLAELRACSPEDATLSKDWADLLQAVHLPITISQQPLLQQKEQNCTARLK